MTTCLLIRHGQSEANVAGLLAGHLDSPLTEAGVQQAQTVGAALREVPLARLISSPLQRCRDTAATIAAEQGDPPKVRIDEAFAEVRYGAWTGRTLKELAGEALWTQIQSRPSTVTFPEHPDHPHESMAEVDERAWAAWLASEQAVAEESGPRALWAVVSHGDVIKAILARALGLELDRFQSIVIDPASVSIVHRHQGRTAVSGMNLRDDVYARLASAATAETGQTPAAATSEPSEQAASSPRDEIENTIGAVGGGNG